jgi:hypothetical protein
MGYRGKRTASPRITNKPAGESPAGYHVFSFSISQQRNRLKYPPVAKILSRISNPANAAIFFTAYPDIGPQYISGLTTHTAGLNRTTLQFNRVRDSSPMIVNQTVRLNILRSKAFLFDVRELHVSFLVLSCLRGWKTPYGSAELERKHGENKNRTPVRKSRSQTYQMRRSDNAAKKSRFCSKSSGSEY